LARVILSIHFVKLLGCIMRYRSRHTIACASWPQ